MTLNKIHPLLVTIVIVKSTIRIYYNDVAFIDSIDRGATHDILIVVHHAIFTFQAKTLGSDHYVNLVSGLM